MDDLREKIRLAMQDDYKGKTLFTEEELALLYSEVGEQLRRLDNNWGYSISTTYDDMVFIALVNIAKKWDADEDRFWGYIAKQLMGIEDVSQKVYRYLTEELFTRLSRRSGFIYLNGCIKRYYATLLAHSFAPKKSIESFFELCWEIYCNDLGQTYVKFDDAFIYIAEELKRRFNNDITDNAFEIGSKAYALRAGIKRLAIDRQEDCIKFIDNTIFLIDKVFRGETLNLNDYFNCLVSKWWQEKIDSIGNPHIRKYSERAVSDYKAIKPKYVFNNGRTVLYIQPIRLLDNIYTNPYIEITGNGKKLLMQEMDTAGSGLLMATKPFEIDMADLELGDTLNLQVEITHCGKVIYFSGSSLNREFIIFNEQREITAQECVPGNYYLFAVDIDNFSSTPSDIKRQSKNLYVIQTHQGDILQNKERIIIFINEKADRDIWLSAKYCKDLIFRHLGEEYSVIDGELEFSAKQETKLDDYGIKVSGVDFKLVDFPCREMSGFVFYNITKLCGVCEPTKIIIFKYSQGKIVSTRNVVKFNNIRVSFDKELYYDNQNSGCVSFVTEKFNESTTFNINQNEVIIPFEQGDLIFNPPIVRWRIDECGWESNANTDGIWYKDFSNSSLMELDVPESFTYSLFVGNEEILQNCTGHAKAKLGQAVFAAITSTIEQEDVILRLSNGEALYITKIYLKEAIKSNPFLQIAHLLIWNPNGSFVGDKDAKFTLLLKENGEKVFAHELNNSQEQGDLSGIEDGFYQMELYLKGKGFLAQDRLLYSTQICVGDKNEIRFKNKQIVINKAMLYNQTSPTNIETFYIDNISFITERDGNPFYLGMVFIKDQYGNKKYLNSMKNEHGDYDRTNPVRIELMNERACWIVAGVEKDDIDDFLGEYTLDSRSRISNYNSKTTKGIDYFIFSTKEIRNV